MTALLTASSAVRRTPPGLVDDPPRAAAACNALRPLFPPPEGSGIATLVKVWSI